ncbi:MAG: GNAT family N-acetyltransferase [Thermoguttaceae bacterium]
MKNLLYTYYFGKDAAPEITALSEFRIKFFREFPYLYVGDLESEKPYINEYLKNPEMVFCIAKDGTKTIAVSTACPLSSFFKSESELSDISQFRDHGYDAAEFYYIGELIVLPEYQNRGISKELLAIQYRIAKERGFNKYSFLAVQRNDTDPLRPKDYTPASTVFEKLGFHKTDMTVSFQWNTLQPNGTAKKQPNTLDFWLKTE